ncbi:MAG: hypothetical protein LBG05_02845 [Treponema sp.]|jgi:hypothetical protein|nr:hypothetical protein [Treponema sp.]
MANGMYDFILAYYNPKSDGAVEGADLKARLPQWPASGLTLDGSANGGVTSRNIGGITADNAYRKGVDGASGEPNANYVGNITVPMATTLNPPPASPPSKTPTLSGMGMIGTLGTAAAERMVMI